MLNKRLAVAALMLALIVMLAPAPSQAAPWGWAAADGPSASAAGLFVKIDRWLSRLLSGAERPAPQKPSPQKPAPAQQKNGCGIDPNGAPRCGG